MEGGGRVKDQKKNRNTLSKYLTKKMIGTRPTPWAANVGRQKGYDLGWINDANGRRVLTIYSDGKPGVLDFICDAVNLVHGKADQ